MPECRPHKKEASIPNKIVFVSDAIYPYMKGGKEKRLHEISKRLAAMGHDVHIYTMHWWPAPDTIIREDGVYLHAICKQYTMYAGDRRTIKEGVMFGLACFKLFRVQFDTIDVDHMPFFPIFSIWFVCLLRGRKLNGTWHETLTQQEWISYMGRAGIVASMIEKVSIRLPHHITAASSHTRDSLVSAHGRKNVSLVASGIDAALLRKVKAAKVAVDVLYAGRLVKDKHVELLVEAVRLLSQTLPEVRCIIIGDGPEKARLQDQVAQHRLTHNITFLEPLAEAADIYAYMKAAKVFCSPSVREGFGITALEALGSGTPVITTNSPENAARLLIEDGKNGSVVALNAPSIALAILHWAFEVERPDTGTHLAVHDWSHLARRQAEAYAP